MNNVWIFPATICIGYCATINCDYIAVTAAYNIFVNPLLGPTLQIRSDLRPTPWRLNYKRDNLRYPSDLTGEEWAHIEALIPPAKHGGRKRKVDVREVVNGIMYVLSTGCQWRYVPKDLPPKSTLYDYFDLWTYDGTLETIHHALYVRCREQIGREASPTAAIIDSQSVKSAEKGGLASTPTAMMRAKKSTARSGTFSSTL